MNVNPFSYLIEKLKGKVDKSGDTMTGKLTIEQNTDTPLSVKRTNTASGVYMEFSNYNGVIGYLGVSANKKPIFHDTTDTQIALMSDITTNSSSITSKNATYINSIWLTCLQLGTLVIVSGSIKPEAVYTPTGSQLISGLPTAKNNGVATAVSGNGDCYKISIAANNDYIRKDENATPVSTWYNLLLVYEAK